MKKFTCVQDIGDLKSALAEAFEIKTYFSCPFVFCVILLHAYPENH